MSTKRLQARLTRLERAVKPIEPKVETKKDPHGFVIETSVLEAMDADFVRLDTLRRDLWLSGGWASSPPDTPEISDVRARIAERVQTIKCPPSYGFKEHWMDVPKISRWEGGWSLSDEERLLARVRMEVFRQTPEGQARIRLDYLENKVLRSSAVYDEIERLLKLYPEPWVDPRATGGVNEALRRRGTQEERKHLAEKHQRWIREKEERRRKEVEQENKK